MEPGIAWLSRPVVMMPTAVGIEFELLQLARCSLHVNHAGVRVCILVVMTACGLPAGLLHCACIELLAPLPML